MFIIFVLQSKSTEDTVFENWFLRLKARENLVSMSLTIVCQTPRPEPGPGPAAECKNLALNITRDCLYLCLSEETLV